MKATKLTSSNPNETDRPALARTLGSPSRIAESANRIQRVLTACVALFALSFFLGTSMAYAEGPELFTLLPADQPKAMSEAQRLRIDRIKQRPTTASVTLVRVAANALKGDSTRISLPEGKKLNFSKSKIETRSVNDFTWFGALSGIAGKATLVVHDNNITGTIRGDDGDLYRVEPVGSGVHALIKVDVSRFPPDEPPTPRKREERRGDAGPRPDKATDTPKSDSPVGIDVLVAHTTAARTAVSDIAATVQLAVAEANQSYENSGINITLTMVDSFEVSYSESGKSFDTILADFVGMADVNKRRNDSGADMAVLIIDQPDFCGLADAILANASNAFAIVHYDCATGYYSFAHELGHLQGARHDPATDPTTTPFAYGHGFQHTSPPPSWRTIMAYNCSGGCSRLQYWSNPNINHSGSAMGTASTSNNARVLNETASTVAGFRTRPPAGTAYGVISGTGSKESGSPNWTCRFNAAAKRYEVSISGENYFYRDYATMVTPSFGTGNRGYCTSGSVEDKLVIECYDHMGNPVAPVTLAFASFKKPDGLVPAKPPLAYGAISGAGNKESGSANWTCSFNAAAKQYEVAISGENYFYRDYATMVTPSFGTGNRGYCTSGSVEDKLVIECYDHMGNPVAPVTLAFASFKKPDGVVPAKPPLAYGAISGAGNKESGSANWTCSFNAAAKRYEVAISGENYFYRNYTTIVTPSFGTGNRGYCTSGSVEDKLLIECYDHQGNPVAPVTFSFVTYKQ